MWGICKIINHEQHPSGILSAIEPEQQFWKFKCGFIATSFAEDVSKFENCIQKCNWIVILDQTNIVIVRFIVNLVHQECATFFINVKQLFHQLVALLVIAFQSEEFWNIKKSFTVLRISVKKIEDYVGVSHIF